MKKRKKKYVGENLKWFMDYLPDEFFNSLSEKERNHYKEYRRYQRFIGESNQRVKKYENQIQKLQDKIKEEKKKVKGSFEEGGWEMKMKIHYDEINHFHKDFTFNCSIERRDRSSKTVKLKERKLNNLTDQEIGVQKQTYKGKPIEKLYKIYGRVQNSKNRVTFYLGGEKDVRNFLSELYNEDFSSDSWEDVKDEVRGIMSQYTRYKVFHSNWEDFGLDTHNLQSLKDWIEWCDNNNVDRYKWGGKTV